MATYNITSVPSSLAFGDIVNCPYDGTQHTLTLAAGIYQLECWGARGGGHYNNTLSGAIGGYSKGLLNLTSSTTLYLTAGGRGTVGSTTGTHAGGYNGGGSGTAYSGGGGGATHIALASGLLSSLQGNQTSILMVAGGGAGSASTGTYNRVSPGLGGGTNGSNGLSILIPNSTLNYTKCFGLGGTQTRAGYALNSSTSCKGAFGTGGNASGSYSSGGGAGFYGGGGSSNYGTGGGGSGYINESRIINGTSTIELQASTNPDTTNYNGYIRIKVKQAGIETGVYIKIKGEWRMISNGIV